MYYVRAHNLPEKHGGRRGSRPLFLASGSFAGWALAIAVNQVDESGFWFKRAFQFEQLIQRAQSSMLTDLVHGSVFQIYYFCRISPIYLNQSSQKHTINTRHGLQYNSHSIVNQWGQRATAPDEMSAAAPWPSGGGRRSLRYNQMRTRSEVWFWPPYCWIVRAPLSRNFYLCLLSQLIQY